MKCDQLSRVTIYPGDLLKRSYCVFICEQLKSTITVHFMAWHSLLHRMLSSAASGYCIQIFKSHHKNNMSSKNSSLYITICCLLLYHMCKSCISQLLCLFQLACCVKAVKGTTTCVDNFIYISMRCIMA